MGKIRISTSALLLGIILMFGACGDSDGDDNAAFKSSVAGANGESGKLSVYIDAAVASSVRINEDPTVLAITGKLELEGGGATTDLTGTYDTVSEELILNGADYSFVGATTSDGRISGDYTKGLEEGIFAGFDSSSNEVKVYCGTYTSDVCTALGCSGVWSATTSSDGHAAGTYYGNDGLSNGTLWGTFINDIMTGEDDHGSIMTGTIADGVVTGTWILEQEGETVTGTFEASTENCP
jgi:hypothetical protein